MTQRTILEGERTSTENKEPNLIPILPIKSNPPERIYYSASLKGELKLTPLKDILKPGEEWCDVPLIEEQQLQTQHAVDTSRTISLSQVSEIIATQNAALADGRLGIREDKLLGRFVVQRSGKYIPVIYPGMTCFGSGEQLAEIQKDRRERDHTFGLFDRKKEIIGWVLAGRKIGLAACIAYAPGTEKLLAPDNMIVSGYRMPDTIKARIDGATHEAEFVKVNGHPVPLVILYPVNKEKKIIRERMISLDYGDDMSRALSLRFIDFETYQPVPIDKITANIATINVHYTYQSDPGTVTFMAPKVTLLRDWSQNKPILVISFPLRNLVVCISPEYFKSQHKEWPGRGDYNINLKSEDVYSIIDYWLKEKGHTGIIENITDCEELDKLQEVVTSIEEKIRQLEQKKSEIKSADVIKAGLFGAGLGAVAGVFGYATIKPLLKPALAQFKLTATAKKAVSGGFGALFGCTVGTGVKSVDQSNSLSELLNDIQWCRRLHDIVTKHMAKLQEKEQKEVGIEGARPGLHSRLQG